MGTVSQRERSERPKVMRALCEQAQNSHQATMRAIWEAQSDERVAREVSEQPFHARLLTKTEDQGAFVLVKLKLAAHPGDHLEWTPGLDCYGKNPSVWPHCWGKNIIFHYLNCGQYITHSQDIPFYSYKMFKNNLDLFWAESKPYWFILNIVGFY